MPVRRFRSYSKPQSNTGIPWRLRTTLRYVDYTTLNGTAPYIQVFRANSLFDPDETSLGHQPAGFAELAQIYDYYWVHGCKVDVTWNSTDSSSTYVAIVPLWDLSAPSYSTVYQYLEDKNVTLAMCSSASVGGNASSASVSKYFDISEWEPLAMDPIFGGAFIAFNPSAEFKFRVDVHEFGSLGNFVEGNIVTKLTFYCEFWQSQPSVL